MATPSETEIVAALRQALPPHLYGLVDPLTRYLLATAELRVLAEAPGSTVPNALGILGGKQLELPSGLSISFGEGNLLGNVTMGDITGGSKITLNIDMGRSVPSPVPLIALDEAHEQILVALLDFPDESVGMSYLEQRTGLTRTVLNHKTRVLHNRGLVHILKAGGEVIQVKLESEGWELAQRIKARRPTPASFGLDEEQVRILRHAQQLQSMMKAADYDELASALGMSEDDLEEELDRLADEKKLLRLTKYAGAIDIALSSQGRKVLAELDGENKPQTHPNPDPGRDLK